MCDPIKMDATEEEYAKLNVYSSMKEDPEYLLSLLDKYVKVELIKKTSFNGFVHSIDPITNSLILFVPNKERLQTTLIPGHAILEISELSVPENTKPPHRKETTPIDDEVVQLRKKKLISWLKKNLLPVKEEDKNIAVGSVNILPPYNATDIYAENHVVALQIKSIIEKLPEDFEF